MIHPSGERWAFEFQCSRISETVWLERHNLYKRANIVDFWILGGKRAKNKTVHSIHLHRDGFRFKREMKNPSV
ncbi:competence protein CoiA family protein [Aneurinibacillus terranovensis]|uniref:competence protein CoiA family protein n=1 Tax=Aneurinibacillus terranovensis TaxID=278991 RepID=UPI00138AE71B